MSSHETPEDDAVSENSSIATDEALHWPTKASTVHSSALSVATELTCDVLLVLASLAVLAFALTVWNYNQRPIEDNKATANALLMASKIVSGTIHIHSDSHAYLPTGTKRSANPFRVYYRARDSRTAGTKCKSQFR